MNYFTRLVAGPLAAASILGAAALGLAAGADASVGAVEQTKQPASVTRAQEDSQRRERLCRSVRRRSRNDRCRRRAIPSCVASSSNTQSRNNPRRADPHTLSPFPT